MSGEDFIDQLWQQQAATIKAFLEMQPRYEKLSEEVAYILSKHLKASGVEYAAITSRAKTLESFCAKLIRKKYNRPLEEVTDLAGVRIVYLYLDDLPKVEEIVEREFKNIEKIDKVEKADPDRFGYGAVHYLVRLGKKSSGARYDDLKDFTCELQVRTVLQDAWAKVAHHLSYKQESDVPKQLRRKLNALSGLFETADDQFNQLRAERLKYKTQVRNEIADGKGVLLKQDIDLDNLTEFLSSRLPDRKPSGRDDIANLILELKEFGYTQLSQLDRALQRTEIAIKAYEAKYPPFDLKTGQKVAYSTVGAIRAALIFTDDDYLKKRERFKDHIDEFKELVKQ